MSNANNITQGHLDRLTGALFSDVPHLDKFTNLAKTIREVDAEEADTHARKAYALMYATSEQLADIVRELRELGHLNTREQRVMGILNDAILALEAEGVGA